MAQSPIIEINWAVNSHPYSPAWDGHHSAFPPSSLSFTTLKLQFCMLKEGSPPFLTLVSSFSSKGLHQLGSTSKTHYNLAA
jgi:hypothetical protein